MPSVEETLVQPEAPTHEMPNAPLTTEVGADDASAIERLDALGASESLPDGVRLVLSLPPGPALSGSLTQDWVRPNPTNAKTS